MAIEKGSMGDPEVLVLRYLDDPRPDLKDLVLLECAPLVERVARRFAGIEAFEDLVQVGYIGLLNALTKYDPSAGVKFNTYATYLVAGEIKHYLRDRSQTIRHPAWLQELRHKVNKTSRVLQYRLGREPTEAEIGYELKIPETTVHEVLLSAETTRVASLDAMPADDDGDSEVERLDASDFCPQQLGVEDRLLLESAMRQLRDLERQVLVHFHFDAMNQTEIAAKLGISCNYVSHILRQSLGKLRAILVSEEEKDRVLRRQSVSLDYDVIDSATGVYTEACFRSRLEEELHRASCDGGAVAVVLIDVDGLDSLKSFYGKQSVDDFMVDAAEFLKSQVRRLDIVARWGANGFAILLPTTGSSAMHLRKRVESRIGTWIASRFSAAGSLAVRLGTASFPEDGRSGKDLLEFAKASTFLQEQSRKAA
ncbi:MAG: sigma-70 family RNA polymerase sigma factor [Armatimonadetes bacterium]|nr:sigma-70 family RNA polymerase sigma factor [Armatimonadota bacterium]